MNRRRLPAWLASLALLMHLLSMPLSGMLPADAKRLLGWSGHCPMQQAGVSPGHAMHGAETAGEHGSGTTMAGCRRAAAAQGPSVSPHCRHRRCSCRRTCREALSGSPKPGFTTHLRASSGPR